MVVKSDLQNRLGLTRDCMLTAAISCIYATLHKFAFRAIMSVKGFCSVVLSHR